MNRILPTLAIGTSLLLSSCENSTIQKEQASQREDILGLQERIGQLQSDVHSVKDENDALKAEVDRLKSDLSSSQSTNAQYQKDIARLDELILKLNSAREQDRKVIVDEVSQEIGRLSKRISGSTSSAATSSSPSKGKSSESKTQEGVEHTVAKGDTLYAVAKAYGVSLQSIKDANKLKSNELHVGQKLFIPKK